MWKSLPSRQVHESNHRGPHLQWRIRRHSPNTNEHSPASIKSQSNIMWLSTQPQLPKTRVLYRQALGGHDSDQNPTDVCRAAGSTCQASPGLDSPTRMLEAIAAGQAHLLGHAKHDALEVCLRSWLTHKTHLVWDGFICFQGCFQRASPRCNTPSLGRSGRSGVFRSTATWLTMCVRSRRQDYDLGPSSGRCLSFGCRFAFVILEWERRGTRVVGRLACPAQTKLVMSFFTFSPNAWSTTARCWTSRPEYLSFTFLPTLNMALNVAQLFWEKPTTSSLLPQIIIQPSSPQRVPASHAGMLDPFLEIKSTMGSSDSNPLRIAQPR